MANRIVKLALCALLNSLLSAWAMWWLVTQPTDPPARAVFIEPPVQPSTQRGGVVDAWRGVVVRHNGEPYWQSHGRHIAEDGFYYGKKWQCVEFVKRFYYDALGHEMPDGMGHAESFYDPDIPHGGWNARRALWQFENGQDVLPQVDDLMVWRIGGYGHVAIVSSVTPTHVRVIQQNVTQGSRQNLPLLVVDGPRYRVGTPQWAPVGWLRQGAPESLLGHQQPSRSGHRDLQ